MNDKLGINLQIDFPFQIAKDNLQNTIKQLQNECTLSFNLDTTNLNKISEFLNDINKNCNFNSNFNSEVNKAVTNTQKLAKETNKFFNGSKEATERIKEYKDNIGNSTTVTENLNQNTKLWDENLKEVTIDYDKIIKEQEKLVNQMAKGREQAELKSKQRDESLNLKQAQAINKEKEKQYTEEQKIINLIEKARLLTIERRNAEQQIWNLKQSQAINKNIENEKLKTKELQEQLKLYKRQQTLKVQNIQRKYENLYNVEELNKYIKSLKEMNVVNGQLNISQKEMTMRLKEIEGQAKNNAKAMHLQDQESKSFLNTLKATFQKFGLWMGVTSIFFGVVNAIKQGIQSITQLDSKVVELKKVTDETENTYKNFIEQSYEVSNALARTGSAVVATSASFARMGFKIQQSMALAKDALILTNIGDGISEEDSTKTLISTLKGFGMEANNSRKIIDSLNEVSNNYAVTVSDLANGIARTSATMAQSNTSFDETLAILTSAVEVLQNAEIASSGIITISQRLRSLSENGESLGKEFTANLQNTFKTIANVDIMDEKGLRSTYDILSDTAKVWKTLTQEQQQFLAEKASGKRQVKVFNAIMQNSNTLLNANKDSINSYGSAIKENEKYLDSIEGKIAKFSSTLEKMWNHTINSDVIKNMIDLGTTFTNILDNLSQNVGLFKIGLIALTTKILLSNNSFKMLLASMFTYDIETKKAVFNSASFKIALQSLIAKILGVKTSLTAVNATMVATRLGVMALESALTLGLSIGITLIVEKISSWIMSSSQLQEKNQETIDEMNQMTECFVNLNDNIDLLLTRYKKLSEKTTLTKDDTEELRNIQEKLNSVLGDSAVAIDDNTNNYKSINEQLQKNIDLKLQEIEINARANKPNARKQIEENIKALDKSVKRVEDIKNSINNDFDYNLLRDKIDLQKLFNEYIVIVEKAKKANNGIFDINKLDFNDLATVKYFAHRKKQLGIYATKIEDIQQEILSAKEEFDLKYEEMDSQLADSQKQDNERIKQNIENYKNWFTEYVELGEMGTTVFEQYLNDNAKLHKRVEDFEQQGKKLIATLNELEMSGKIDLKDGLQINELNLLKNALKNINVEINNMDNLFQITPQSANKTTQSLKYMSKNYEELDSTINDVQKSGKDLSSVYEQLNEGQKLSSDQILDMIQDYPELLDLIDEENGLNLQSANIYDQLFNIKKRNTLQTLQDEEDKAQVTIDSLNARKNAYLGYYKAMDGMIIADPNHFDPGGILTDAQQKEIDKSIELAEKDKAQIKARIDAFNNLTLNSFQSHTKSSTSKSKSTSNSLTEVTGKLTEFSTAFKVAEEKINNTSIAINKLNEQLKDTEDIEKRKKLEQELAEQYEIQNDNYRKLINENRKYLVSTLNDLSEVTSIGIDDINKAFKFDKTGIVGFNPTEYGKLLDSIKNKILSNNKEIKRINSKKYTKEQTEAIQAQLKPLEDENEQLLKLYDNMGKYVDNIQNANEEIKNTKDSVVHLTDKTAELNQKLKDDRKKQTEDYVDSYCETVKKGFQRKKELYEREHKQIIDRLQNRIDNEKDYYDNKKERIEEDRDRITSALQEEIDKKQKQLDQNKKLIEQEKRLAEIADLRKKVANIKKNRNVRILTENGWEWVADKKALEDAQKELDDKLQQEKETRDEEAKQKEIDNLRDKLNAEKKYYDKKLDKLEKSHNEELDYLNHMMDAENKSYEKQKDIIDDYYEFKINSIENAEDKEITYVDIMKDLTKDELELYDDKIKKIHELEKAKLDCLDVGDIDYNYKSSGSSSSHSSSSGSSSSSHSSGSSSNYGHNDGDKKLLNQDEKDELKDLADAYKTAKKKGNDDVADYFHKRAEDIRKEHGYSGGVDGSKYKRLGTGGTITQKGIYMLGDSLNGDGDQVETVLNSEHIPRIHNALSGSLNILNQAEDIMKIGQNALFDTIPKPNLNIPTLDKSSHESIPNQIINKYDVHVDKVETPDVDSFINILPTIAKNQ